MQEWDSKKSEEGGFPVPSLILVCISLEEWPLLGCGGGEVPHGALEREEGENQGWLGPESQAFRVKETFPAHPGIGVQGLRWCETRLLWLYSGEVPGERPSVHPGCPLVAT